MNEKQKSLLLILRNACQQKLYARQRFASNCVYMERVTFHGEAKTLAQTEFDEIQERSKRINIKQAGSIGLLAANEARNRYKDVVPYNFNRVRLNNDDINRSVNDYINASYIRLPHDVPMIAAQGPTPHTTGDFLFMVWQENVSIIVCAVNEIEHEKSKCTRYWPNNMKEEYRTKQFVLRLAKEPVEMFCNGNFIIRTLRLTSIALNKSRYLRHYHFILWPDTGVPDNLEAAHEMLLSIKRDLHQCQHKSRRVLGRVLVHCSAGCGRTGTLIGLSCCYNILNRGIIKDIERLSVKHIVMEMRRQRMGMVQTLIQYRFIYQIVVFAIDKLLESADGGKLTSQQMNDNEHRKTILPNVSNKYKAQTLGTSRPRAHTQRDPIQHEQMSTHLISTTAHYHAMSDHDAGAAGIPFHRPNLIIAQQQPPFLNSLMISGHGDLHHYVAISADEQHPPAPIGQEKQRIENKKQTNKMDDAESPSRKLSIMRLLAMKPDSNRTPLGSKLFKKFDRASSPKKK